MYGWRARIGHVAPSRGDTLVYEFYKMFPEGFMMLNTTGTVRQLVDSDFEAQLSRIEEAVQDLVDNNCDSIIFSGSPLFTRLPFGADRELGKKLSDKFGVPVAAGLTAEVEALKAMKCTKPVVGFAHAPHGPLAGAKAARGVDLLTRAVEVDLNVETVFAASVTKALNGGNLDLIDARTQFVIARVTDDIITLAN